ncbi:MAG: hypothetical protein LBL39_02520, partial [Planctomycetaceae bacterium]|nr:hypothetical protein [Planctomycetaceae bacterium]
IDHTGCGVLTNSNTDIDSNGAEMNRENLENYGTAVLSGRPPFVRKEPVYVYQTNVSSGFKNEFNKNQESNVDVETRSQNIVTKIPELDVAEKNVGANASNNVVDLSLENTSELNNEREEDKVESVAITEFRLPEIPRNNWEEEELTKIISIWTNPNTISSDITDDENENDNDDSIKNTEDEKLPVSVVSLSKSSKSCENCVACDVGSSSEVAISGNAVSESIRYGEIVLEWVHEPFDDDHGFGVAYREFAAKSDSTTELVLPTTAIVPRLTNEHDATQTSFDEHFDETICVERSTITLDEAYRSIRKIQDEQQISPNTLIEAEQQIVNAIKRITRAADKIESAADQTEQAGRKVEDAADLAKLAGQKINQTATTIETEITTAIPSYKDLFKQLVDFQKTITHEVQTLKYINEDQSENYQNNNENISNENNFSRPHDLKTYRNRNKRLSKPVSSDNLKLPTAEKRGSEIKTIDINALFQDSEE